MAGRIGALLRGRLGGDAGRSLLTGYVRRERGNVAAMMALLLVPLVGALGMAVEASSWSFMSRTAQNAADSAAIAAANNASASATSEAQANVQQYGFASSAVAVSSGVQCPDGKSACYKATVTQVLPIYLTRVVGFNGDVTLSGGRRGKTITSIALAEPLNPISYPSCLTSMGSDNASKNNVDAIDFKGTASVDMAGCALSAVGPSPSSITCNSHALGAAYGFATGTVDSNGKCQIPQKSGGQSSSQYCNPYAANIPAGCPSSTYAADVATAVSGASGTSCTLSGGKLTAVTQSCTYSGNLSLKNAITGPTAGAVVVVTNGNLDLAGNSSTGVTYVLNGSSPGTVVPGNINLEAPGSTATTGTQGIAVFQTSSNSSPTITSWTENGGGQINITGLLYLPFTNVDFGGDSGSGGDPKHCYIAVFNSLEVHGTGYTFDRSGCTAAGLKGLPTIQRLRAALVQ
jgi:hypothetical protein